MEFKSKPPPEKGKPPARARSEGPSHAPAEAPTQTSNSQSTSQVVLQHDSLSSRTVDWWRVHMYRQRMLQRLGVLCFPAVGTAAWDELGDDDPVKLAAVVDAAQHWALRVDNCQGAMAEASKAVSAAADWDDFARRTRDREEFVKANPWAQRVIV